MLNSTRLPSGGANRAVRTTLAMMKPIDKMLQVLRSNARLKATTGTSVPEG